MKRLFLWGPVLAHMAFIFFLSSITKVGDLPGRMSDKAAHFLVYGLLGFLIVRALSGGSLTGMTAMRAITAVVLAGLYGVTDEIHQSFVPGRNPDVLDVVADTLGAGGAVALIYLLRYFVASVAKRQR
jgi:VanZ family protein